MERVGLVLEPLDVLFFRGGRPFDPGMPGESNLPSPQVFAGGMRTFLLEKVGADFGKMKGAKDAASAFAAAGADWLSAAGFRGPWLADIRAAEQPRPMVRMPANLVMNGDELAPLLPCRSGLPGWNPPVEGLLPLWRQGAKAEKRRPQWLSFEGLGRYLRGEALSCGGHSLQNQELYGWETRTGIELQNHRQTAEEGKIYSTRSLRLASGIGIYGEVELPSERTHLFNGQNVLCWGGERHAVTMRRVAPVVWPDYVTGKRKIAMLLTPCFSDAGWLPDGLKQETVRGAAVAETFAVSGWDLARGGPKPTRFGVDAGSVYFLEGEEPRISSLSRLEEDVMTGYGLFAQGRWDYAD